MVIALVLQVTLAFHDSLPLADPVVRTAVRRRRTSGRHTASP